VIAWFDLTIVGILMLRSNMMGALVQLSLSFREAARSVSLEWGKAALAGEDR
jgi:hypothetical protein